MRVAFIALVLLGFAGLAAVDLMHGDIRTGTAAALLALANALLLAVV